MDALFSKWIDCRDVFRKYYGDSVKLNIETMLAALQMKFEGRPHSGLADSRNLARIVLKMLANGCDFQHTSGTLKALCMKGSVSVLHLPSTETSFKYGIYSNDEMTPQTTL